MDVLRIACAAICLALAAGCQTVSRQAGGTTVVVATGDPVRDLRAVQDALDRGGTVALRGTFNFGSGGQLVIRREVRLVLDDARLQGGGWVFYSP